MSDPSGAAWFPGCAPTRHSCGPRGPSVLCDAPQELAATETVSAPLFSAVKAGDTPLVSSLLARGFFIDCTDRVRVPTTTCTRWLQRRARWDSHLCSPGFAPPVEQKGWTPLHHASDRGYVPIARLLLKHNATPDLKAKVCLARKRGGLFTPDKPYRRNSGPPPRPRASPRLGHRQHARVFCKAAGADGALAP